MAKEFTLWNKQKQQQQKTWLLYYNQSTVLSFVGYLAAYTPHRYLMTQETTTENTSLLSENRSCLSENRSLLSENRSLLSEIWAQQYKYSSTVKI